MFIIKGWTDEISKEERSILKVMLNLIAEIVNLPML